MRGILAWLAVTLTLYLGAGYWVGASLRPAIQHEQATIIQPVERVTAVLR